MNQTAASAMLEALNLLKILDTVDVRLDFTENMQIIAFVLLAWTQKSI